MFVRVNRVDGEPDDSQGKGGWWTVQPGVPDEGRPGRKGRGKRGRGGAGGGKKGDKEESASVGAGEEDEGVGDEAPEDEERVASEGAAEEAAGAGVVASVGGA